MASRSAYRPLPSTPPAHSPHGSVASSRSRTPGQLSLHDYRKRQASPAPAGVEAAAGSKRTVKRKGGLPSFRGPGGSVPNGPPTPPHCEDDEYGSRDGSEEEQDEEEDDDAAIDQFLSGVRARRAALRRAAGERMEAAASGRGLGVRHGLASTASAPAALGIGHFCSDLLLNWESLKPTTVGIRQGSAAAASCRVVEPTALSYNTSSLPSPPFLFTPPSTSITDRALIDRGSFLTSIALLAPTGLKGPPFSLIWAICGPVSLSSTPLRGSQGLHSYIRHSYLHLFPSNPPLSPILRLPALHSICQWSISHIPLQKKLSLHRRGRCQIDRSSRRQQRKSKSRPRCQSS